MVSLKWLLVTAVNTGRTNPKDWAPPSATHSLPAVGQPYFWAVTCMAVSCCQVLRLMLHANELHSVHPIKLVMPARSESESLYQGYHELLSVD